MPPRRVGVFEILSVIGRGGVGTVYRARHLLTGEPAAVKVLGPAPVVDPTVARRLAREYEVLRSIQHPNVVRVYDAGVHDGYPFLAMELVDGLDLRRYLSPIFDDPSVGEPSLDDVEAALADSASWSDEQGSEASRALAAMMDEPETEPLGYPRAPAPTPEAAAPGPPRASSSAAVRDALNHPGRILRLRTALGQVADALAYVHARGLVHRDIKPSNVMVDHRRSARLMDFGLVKAASEAESALTQAGRVVGTYRYMSPEQAQGLPVDARSDLYSLGVILYELLAGVPPFAASEPVGLWREILTTRPPPVRALNPGADPALASLAEALLEKDPQRRPASAVQVLGALGAGAAGAGAAL